MAGHDQSGSDADRVHDRVSTELADGQGEHGPEVDVVRPLRVDGSIQVWMLNGGPDHRVSLSGRRPCGNPPGVSHA